MKKHFQITVETQVKAGSNFRSLYTTPTFDYCAFRRGASTNALFKNLMDEIKTTSNVFQECPIESKIEVRNLDIKDDRFYAIYPTGTYRSLTTISNKNQTKNLTLTIDYAIKSPNKFG